MNALRECRSSVAGLRDACGTHLTADTTTTTSATAAALATCEATDAKTNTEDARAQDRQAAKEVRCFRLLRYCPAAAQERSEACSNSNSNGDAEHQTNTSSSPALSCAGPLTARYIDELSPITPHHTTANNNNNNNNNGSGEVEHGHQECVYALWTVAAEGQQMAGNTATCCHHSSADNNNNNNYSNSREKEEWEGNDDAKITDDPLCPHSPPCPQTSGTFTSTSPARSVETAKHTHPFLVLPPPPSSLSSAETQILLVSPDRLPGSALGMGDGSPEESSAATVLTSSSIALSSESSMQTTATTAVPECGGPAPRSALRGSARRDASADNNTVTSNRNGGGGGGGHVVHVQPTVMHMHSQYNSQSGTSAGLPGKTRFPDHIGRMTPLSGAAVGVTAAARGGKGGGAAAPPMWSSAPRSGPHTVPSSAAHAMTAASPHAALPGKAHSTEYPSQQQQTTTAAAVTTLERGTTTGGMMTTSELNNPLTSTCSPNNNNNKNNNSNGSNDSDVAAAAVGGCGKALSPPLLRHGGPERQTASPPSAALPGWKAPTPASIASPRDMSTPMSGVALPTKSNASDRNIIIISSSSNKDDASGVHDGVVLPRSASVVLHADPQSAALCSRGVGGTTRASCAASTSFTESTSAARGQETQGTAPAHVMQATTTTTTIATTTQAQPVPAVLPKATLSLALAVDISKRSGNVRVLLTHYMNYERELLWRRLCEHHPCLVQLAACHTAHDAHGLSVSLRASLLRLYLQSFHDAMRRLSQGGQAALVSAQRFASGAALRARALAHVTSDTSAAAATSGDGTRGSAAAPSQLMPPWSAQQPPSHSVAQRERMCAAVHERPYSAATLQLPAAVNGLEHVFSDLCRDEGATHDTRHTFCAGTCPVASPSLPSSTTRLPGHDSTATTTKQEQVEQDIVVREAAPGLLNLQEMRRYVKLDADYFTTPENSSIGSSTCPRAGLDRRLSEHDSLRLCQLRALQQRYGACRAQSGFLRRYLPEQIETTRLLRWLRASGDDMATIAKVMQYEMWSAAQAAAADAVQGATYALPAEAETLARDTASPLCSRAASALLHPAAAAAASSAAAAAVGATTHTTREGEAPHLPMTPEVRERLRRCVVQVERDEESMQWSVGLEEAIRKRRLAPEAALDLIHCLEDDPNTVVRLWYSATGETMNMFRLLLYTLRPRAAR